MRMRSLSSSISSQRNEFGLALGSLRFLQRQVSQIPRHWRNWRIDRQGKRGREICSVLNSLICSLGMYSLQQKHCPTSLDEKSMVFLTVKYFEILHASAYDIYNYIHIVRKNATASARLPAAARRGRSKRHSRALVYSHSDNQRRKSSVILLPFCTIVQCARWQLRPGLAECLLFRVAIRGNFFTLYM